MLSGAGGFSRAVGWLARLYLGAPNVMTPFAPAIDAAVQDAEANPDRRRRIAGLVRRSWRANLAFEKLLGANPRTIILGFSMALGSPLYFFLVESVLLNLLLVWSVRHHNAVAGRIVARIREGATPARAGAEQAGREG